MAKAKRIHIFYSPTFMLGLIDENNYMNYLITPAFMPGD